MATLRINRKPSFNEKKATQAAAILLKLNNGHMNYMKLIKLLYNIDREALKRWERPVTFDDFYSMPHGLVVSSTLDKAEQQNPSVKSYWDNYIITKDLEDYLVEDCGDEELSPSEINLITEMYEKYEDKNQFDMAREHHDSKLFPEYQDPGTSCIKTDYETVLKVLGFTDDQIEEFTLDIEELSYLEAMA